jgi:hypothetical protein
LAIFFFASIKHGEADSNIVITTTPHKVLSDIEKVSIETGIATTTIEAILKCESGNNQSARHLNSNGTWDIGVAQINLTWGKVAEKMGINILTREGNLEFMTYLIKKDGLSDWKASKSCWSIAL